MFCEQTEGSKIIYKEKRQAVKRICRIKKNEYLEAKLKRIEEEHTKKDIKKFYKEIKN